MGTARMSLMKTCTMVVAFLFVLLTLSAMAADLNRQLFDAARAGNVEQVKNLLSRGADVNTGGFGSSILEHAALGGNLEMAKLLIERGADVNAENNNGWTVLMSAASGDTRDVMRRLREQRADTKAKKNKAPTDWREAEQGNLEVVKFLIEKGADVNARDKSGHTAVKVAAAHRHGKLVEFLKAHGARE
jgi:ankyrin repeat protein